MKRNKYKWREYFIPYKVLTSYSTLLEICKSRISGRKNREKRDERIHFISSFIVQYNNINYLYKNYKYFLYNPYRREIILILYNR